MVTEFLNPYNFIPLPDKKAKAYQTDDKNSRLHTGVIEYSITTRSPLFIPNTSNDDAFMCGVKEHVSYDFYSYEELPKNINHKDNYREPVIPGSELRGMIRNVYETLTDSCMGVLNEKTHPVMRVNEAFKAALLKRVRQGEKVSYELIKAEDCIYRKNEPSSEEFKKLYAEEKTPEGAKVFFHKIIREEMTERGKKKYKSLIKEIHETSAPSHNTEGYLIKGMPDGSIGKKHNCHVFVAEKEKISGFTQSDIDGLMEVLIAYQNEPGASNAYAEYKKELENFLQGKGNEFFPVYYSQVKDEKNSLIYLAPACFTKERAKKSIGDLAGDLAPCRKEECKCPACDLFGMIGEDNTTAGASKVRFADAKAKKADSYRNYYDDVVTLETLSYPRINNVEFYLKRPEEAKFENGINSFWNYDYYMKNGSAVIYEATLRGRKFYWHQRDKELRKDVEKTNLNKTVRPVKSGITFNGKLFFDKISDRQLQQLLWILNGGTDQEQPVTGKIAYKLGMGKPLGLGSVELKVTGLTERILRIGEDRICYDVQKSMPDILEYSDEAMGFSEYVKDDFFTISSLDATKGKTVTYPIVKGQEEKPMTEGFKWFSENHIGYDLKQKKDVRMPQERGKMRRMKELPVIKGIETLPVSPRFKENKNQIEWKGNTNKTNPEQKQENKFKKGDTITCKLTEDAKQNGKDGYAAKIAYNGLYGKVYKIPNALTKGTEIKMRINNEEMLRGYYCK